eukprot:TRINITY_DN29493_c0_g1_i1.p1 TRINITY_DN29493_c0_g1~~TRINITY_DN29493_c0_g1_i1.p1  ORF type:complete len:234 (+),score=10.44 TRINITY_DN29493_c0_g1_i1:86-787(+)
MFAQAEKKTISIFSKANSKLFADRFALRLGFTWHEALIYSMFSKAPPPVRVPKSYYHNLSCDTDLFILLEHLAPAETHHSHKWQNKDDVPSERIKYVFKSIGKLQAHYWNKKSIPKQNPWLLDHIFPLDQTIFIWNQVWPTFDKMYGDQLSTEFKQFLSDPSFLRVVVPYMFDEVLCNQTLVHRDCRIGNLMFHPRTPEDVIFIDWQCSTFGNPMDDLSYLLSDCRKCCTANR